LFALLLGHAFKFILFESPHLLSILNIDKQKRLFSLRPVDIIGKVSYKRAGLGAAAACSRPAESKGTSGSLMARFSLALSFHSFTVCFDQLCLN